MMPTYEKIETTVLCRKSGTYGTLIEKAPNQFKLYVDGQTFYVKSTELGWQVKRLGSNLVSIDPCLLEAAREICVTR